MLPVAPPKRRLPEAFRRAVIALVLLSAFAGPGCRPQDGREAGPSAAKAAATNPITLGDVEADEPLRRVRWIQPLADHLAENLADSGIDGGRVVVARGLDEMARFLREGTVDVYLDSPLPTLAVVRASESRIILRRWVRDQPEYWSLFLTHKDSGLQGPGGLDGRTVAFQERHSTTGFLLPVHTLIERGYQIRTVSEPARRTPPGQIGCFFSGDEENSIQLLLTNAVAAAVVSNQDFEELPSQLKKNLRILDSTPSVPRQLVSVRPGLDPALVGRIRQLLLRLTDEDRARLAAKVDGGGWTWRFDELPPASLARLESYSATLAELSID